MIGRHSSRNQWHGLALGGAEDCAVDNLLAYPGNSCRERSLRRVVVTEAMDHELNGILERRLQLVGPNLFTRGFTIGLHVNGGFIIVAADRAMRALEDKPAFRLRLMFPGIGKSAPARFKFRQAAAVTG